MPEHYLVPKRLVRLAPTLSQAISRLEAALLSVWTRLLRLLPPQLANKFAATVFGLFGPLGDKGVKAKRNLRIVFPDEGEKALQRLVRKTFHHLGMASVELAQAQRLWDQRHERLELVFEDQRIQEILQPGKPAVLVSAHVGAWQYTVMLGPLLGLRLTSLFAPESNPHIRKMFLPLRESLGCNWIPRDNSMRPLMKELAAGNCVGLVTDIRVDQGEMLPLFGHLAATNIVPAKLAIRFDCPLIAVRCDRLRNQCYRIVLSKLITADHSCGDADAQALQMSADLNSEFESWIKKSPGQWLCLSRRWPKEIERGTPLCKL